MYDQATWTDSISAISSLESAFGATRFAVPDGGTTDLFGQVPVRANLSARQAKELGLMTSGTYGRISNGSSKSANLQSSLESKLQARLSTTGSTLYTLTWKPWVTPSGVSRSRLRASVRRTSETETTGWPTPNTMDVIDRQGLRPSRVATNRSSGYLTEIVPLAGWPTPMVGSSGTENYNGSNSTDSSRKTEALCGKEVAGHNLVLSGWPTPQTSDGSGGGQAARAMGETRHGSNLNDFAMLATGPARLTATGVMLTGSAAGMESGGQLNPAHSRWLQGLPPVWCACAVMAMQLMPKPQKRGSKQ